MSILFVILKTLGFIVLAYIIYMAIGIFIFNRAAKKNGFQRTIIQINQREGKKLKSTPKAKRKK